MRLNMAWSASLGLRQYPIQGHLGQGALAFVRGNRMKRRTPPGHASVDVWPAVHAGK